MGARRDDEAAVGGNFVRCVRSAWRHRMPADEGTVNGTVRSTGSARLRVWVAAPQLIVLAVVAVGAAVAEYGWSLLALLAISTALSLAIASLAWGLLLRLRQPPGIVLGALVGLLVGIAAAGLSFAAAAADKHVGPRFGGSLLGDLFGAGIQAGMKQGNELYRTGTAIDVATIPHRAVVGVAGAFFVVMVMGAVILGAIALPILTGLAGGIAAALAERHAY
jgi:hypothetical protein